MNDGNFSVAPLRGTAGVTYHALAFCLTLLILFLAPASASAKNYALLIGVSNYTFKEITPLKGPPNDVTLMWRALGKRGFSDFTILADGLPSGPNFPKSNGNPTRVAILNAFATLAQSASVGDLVLIYFSGHGTEQPVRDKNQDPERGNLDQVLLPIDAGAYDRATKTVRNGIVDDEIGAALDKIREHGADVWVIIDACHAGSVTRGAIPGMVARGIDPSRLGVPQTRAVQLRGAEANKGSRLHAKPATGRNGSIVEFFAVDSSREAIEYAVPDFAPPMVGQGSDRRAGAFTSVLYRVLRNSSGQIATYRDLAHQVVRDMEMSRAAPPALPTFSGGLDRPLLSIANAPPPEAWQVKLSGNVVEVPAGALHGINDRAVLRLSTSPAPDGPQWATATVTKAEPIAAVAEINAPVPDKKPQALWARVASSGVSFALKVAEPPVAELADTAARRLLPGIKAHLVQSGRGAIDWVGANDSADVRLRVRDGRLWLLPADGEWVREDSRRDVPKLKTSPLTPSFPLNATATAGNVGEALHKIARARNMVRLAGIADPSRLATTPWNALQVTAERVPAPPPTTRGSASGPPPGCASRSYHNDLKGEPIDLKLPEPVFHCDLVRITVRNTGPRDVDLNISYIDAASGITAMSQDCTVTVPPGGQLVRSLWIKTWNEEKNAPDSIGREHVVITAVERMGVSQTDLCFVQDAVKGIDITKRGGNIMPGNAGWLMTALSEAAVAAADKRGVQVPEEDDAGAGGTRTAAARAGMYLVTLQVTPTPLP